MKIPNIFKKWLHKTIEPEYIKDKRIEWCKKHCIDNNGDSYIENLYFNESEFIEIDTSLYPWIILRFNGYQLPDFINFKVKDSCIDKTHIDIRKCPNLKSWQGLPTEKVNDVGLVSELENIDFMPMCTSINHIFIKDR